MYIPIFYVGCNIYHFSFPYLSLHHSCQEFTIFCQMTYAQGAIAAVGLRNVTVSHSPTIVFFCPNA